MATDLKGDRFQNYLLEEAFKALVAGASVRMRDISNRYTLEWEDSEFYVVDHDNAGERRRADTLSGGETFMASLCLALQLSEEVLKTSGALQMDSLFIDEGFGTLDTRLAVRSHRRHRGARPGRRPPDRRHQPPRRAHRSHARLHPHRQGRRRVAVGDGARGVSRAGAQRQGWKRSVACARSMMPAVSAAVGAGRALGRLGVDDHQLRRADRRAARAPADAQGRQRRAQVASWRTARRAAPDRRRAPAASYSGVRSRAIRARQSSPRHPCRSRRRRSPRAAATRTGTTGTAAPDRWDRPRQRHAAPRPLHP